MSSTLNVKLLHHGEPVPFGAYVRVAFNQDTDEQAYSQHFTDQQGTVAFEFTPPGPKRIYPHAAGLSVAPVDVVMPHDDQVIIEMDGTPAQGTASEAGFLRVRGQDLITEDDRPWCLAGYASYTLISEVAKGHDIDPFLDEAISYGANTIVTLGMDLGPFAHDHGFAVDPRHPDWPHWLTAIYDRTAAKQLRAAVGLFQQAQPLSDTEKRQAWERYQDVTRGRWNAIGRLGNESDVNGWKPDMVARPTNTGGVLYTSGSRGINNKPDGPQWDICEWEPPREPKAKTFSDSGGAIWYIYSGYEGLNPFPGPVVCIEPPFFHETERDQWGDKRWFRPEDALTLGLNIGANCAGGVFGSSESLESRPNGPIAAQCAREFFRGMRAAFLR